MRPQNFTQWLIWLRLSWSQFEINRQIVELNAPEYVGE